MLRRSLLALTAAFWALLVAGPAIAQSNKTLRVVMHSDLKILDPVWTTAYTVRVDRRRLEQLRERPGINRGAIDRTPCRQRHEEHGRAAGATRCQLPTAS